MPLLQLDNVADEFPKTPVNLTLYTIVMGIYQNDQEKFLFL